MKKRLFILLAVFAVVFCIASCAKKQETSKSTVNPVVQQEQTKTVENEPANEPESESAKPETIIVYAKVPEDWKFTNIWAWENSSGKNAFEGANWPGIPMIQDPDNQGWYYIYVPGYVDIVIINGQSNGSDVQTDGLEIKGDSWITVNADKTANIVANKITQGNLPADEQRHWVYATVDSSWGNPCLWAWNVESGKGAFSSWPGLEMRPMGNNMYCGMVPDFCDGLIINGNGGTVQTADIKDLDPSDIWVSVDKDGKEDVSYSDPSKKVENINIYAKVPEDWVDPCLWAWSDPDGAGAYTTWPGAQFEKDDNGWYKISVGGWINSVIVNANGGTIQTGDEHKGNIEKGKDFWIVVTSPEVSTVYYEEPKL